MLGHTMVGVSVLLMILFLVFLHLISDPIEKLQKTKPPPSDNNMKCPTCNCILYIEEMLDAAVFFEPGAIVFDCWQCHDRVYFAPYENHVEMGILACSPVIDPIPCNDYLYPTNFDMISNIQEEILHIHIGTRSWEIPLYSRWIKNRNISYPNPSLQGTRRDEDASLP